MAYRACDALQQSITRHYRQAGIKQDSSHSGRRSLAAKVLATIGDVVSAHHVLALRGWVDDLAGRLPRTNPLATSKAPPTVGARLHSLAGRLISLAATISSDVIRLGCLVVRQNWQGKENEGRNALFPLPPTGLASKFCEKI